MGQQNLRKLKRTVYLMVLLAIITFLSGFLKYTPFEHITIFLLFILFLGGVKLFFGAASREISGYSRFFLILTGIATMVFMILVAIAMVMTLLSDLTLSENLEFLESIFYVSSLLFLIGAIGAIISLNVNGSSQSTQTNS